MRVLLKSLSLLALSALVLLTGCSQHRPTLQMSHYVEPGAATQVLAAYQPWFGRSGHIDVGYSSQDTTVLARQIEQARDLGISAFVVNWYGPRKDFEDRSYAKLQRIAAEKNFKTALMYDEITDDPAHNTDDTITDLNYAWEWYIGPHAQARGAYLRYNNRPVIFIFPKGGNTDWKRVRQAVDSWSDPPLLIYKDANPRVADTMDGFYAWVTPGGKGWEHDGSNWGKDYLDDFYRNLTGKFSNKIAVGAAWPGFNDSRAAWSRNRRMDARCGKTFDESLRMYHKYFNDQRPLPFLMIVTWNDYEEGTAIEQGLNTCSSAPATSLNTAAQ